MKKRRLIRVILTGADETNYYSLLRRALPSLNTFYRSGKRSPKRLVLKHVKHDGRIRVLSGTLGTLVCVIEPVDGAMPERLLTAFLGVLLRHLSDSAFGIDIQFVSA